jgi:hypothetical protein
MRGDKPTPTNLKISAAERQEGRRALSRQTPTPGQLIEPPDWFTGDQKTAWAYAIENAPRDVLRRIDKGVLAGSSWPRIPTASASIMMAQS